MVFRAHHQLDGFHLSLEPTFVARAFAGDIKQLTGIAMKAASHDTPRFAFVDVLQEMPDV